jgi:hypothetical protein
MPDVRADVEEMMLRQRRRDHRRDSSASDRPKSELCKGDKADVRIAVEQVQLKRHGRLQEPGLDLEMDEKDFSPIRSKQRAVNRLRSRFYAHIGGHIAMFGARRAGW